MKKVIKSVRQYFKDKKKKREHLSNNPPKVFKGDFKSYFKYFIWFVWYDESFLSWVVNLILAFIIIKFIVYPLLALILGTNIPVVAVVSESMVHSGTFDDWTKQTALCYDNMVCSQYEWYLQHNITRDDFKNFNFHNGFNKGDVIVLVGTDFKDIAVGDVIVFQASKMYPIIHRVVDTFEEDSHLYFHTKGDNNIREIKDSTLNEFSIDSDNYLGRAFFRIPYVGYVKIIFVDLLTKLVGQ